MEAYSYSHFGVEGTSPFQLIKIFCKNQQDMQEAFTSSPSEMRLILNPFDRYLAQYLLSSCKEILWKTIFVLVVEVVIALNSTDAVIFSASLM